MRTICGTILAATVGFVALGNDQKCPISENVRGHENIEWSTSYAYGLTDETCGLPRVLLVGDSICNEYQRGVRERLKGKMNVTYWVSSYCVTSPAYLPLLSIYLDEAKYDVIHFNNGHHTPSKTPMEAYSKGLEAAFDLIRRKQPQAKLVWCSTTPLKSAAMTVRCRERNEAASKVVGKIGGVAIDDLFALCDPLDRESYWRDNHHFRPAAVAMQAEQVAASVLAAGSDCVARMVGHGHGVPRTWEVTDGGMSNSTGRIKGVNPIWIEGEPFQGKPTRIFAWWGLPADASVDRKVPAMVLVHGGGGTAFASWVKRWTDRGYAAIAMDTCGGAPLGEKDGRPHPRHAWSGPYGWGDARGYPDGPLADQWPYQAVTAIIRCHSFIRSLPEVDAERTGITGISWGGYLTSVTMGVDHRFKFAAPVYGCGWYDLNPVVWKNVAGGGDKFLRWLDNWDAKHYIGDTLCPVLRCNGNLDIFYTMEMTRRSTEALPKSTPSYLSIKHKMAHGHPPAGDPKEIAAWADYYLKGGARPLSVIEAKMSDGRMAVRIDPGDEEAVSAVLLYTKEGQPSSPNVRFSDSREWIVVPIDGFTRGATSVSVDVPAEALIFFVNVKTAAGLVATTPIVERERNLQGTVPVRDELQRERYEGGVKRKEN